MIHSHSNRRSIVGTALLLALTGCAVVPKPVVKPLAARTWELPAGMSYEEAIQELTRLAVPLGYAATENKDGFFLRGPRFYASEIDRYCIYPVINARTGDRMHTFATWQAEMNRLLSYQGRAFGLVEIQVLRNQNPPLRALTFCRAFTELDIQPAESTGEYERDIFAELLRAAAEAR